MTNSIPLTDLESSGAASFTQLGQKYAGRITAISERQQTDPVTGQGKTFPSGDPMMLLIITIEPSDGSDAVGLWAKGGNFKAATGSGEAMKQAIGAAVRKAGVTTLDVGGQLAVAWTGETEAKPGMNPAKLYTAEYRPPAPETASVPVDLFSS